MKLLLPLILLLFGIGGGVGAGMFLIPPPARSQPKAACRNRQGRRPRAVQFFHL